MGAAWLEASGLDPCRWNMPPASVADRDGLVAVGADLAPSTLLWAYTHGIFPMPVSRRHLGWWSPNPRGVLPLDRFEPSRSLRRSCRRYQVRMNTGFEAVMRSCADPRRPHGWITDAFVDAYVDLHRRGLAHSVETLDRDGTLVGGLYGVAVGGFFAGESMFHRATDASKVALAHLIDRLRSEGATLLDVQWVTPHLTTLGAVPIDREDYLDRLAEAIGSPTRPSAD